MDTPERPPFSYMAPARIMRENELWWPYLDIDTQAKIVVHAKKTQDKESLRPRPKPFGI